MPTRIVKVYAETFMGFSLVHLKAVSLKQLALWGRWAERMSRGWGWGEEPPMAGVQLAGHTLSVTSCGSSMDRGRGVCLPRCRLWGPPFPFPSATPPRCRCSV